MNSELMIALIEKTKQVKWEIADYVSRKYGSWSESQLEIEDQDFPILIKAIQDALDYHKEYKDGDFEFRRFLAKFTHQLNTVISDPGVQDLNAVKSLVKYKRYLLEVYESGYC